MLQVQVADLDDLGSLKVGMVHYISIENYSYGCIACSLSCQEKMRGWLLMFPVQTLMLTPQSLSKRCLKESSSVSIQV